MAQLVLCHTMHIFQLLFVGSFVEVFAGHICHMVFVSVIDDYFVCSSTPFGMLPTTGYMMGDCPLKTEPSKQGCSQSLAKLFKDHKAISRVACVNPPSQMPVEWNISSIVRKEIMDFLSGLPGFQVRSACEDHHQKTEWGNFLTFLRKHNRVAISDLGSYVVYILCNGDSECGLATVLYKEKDSNVISSKKCDGIEIAHTDISPSPLVLTGEAAVSNSDLIGDVISPEQQYPEVIGNYFFDLKTKGGVGLRNSAGAPRRSVERNFVTAHPSYLKTLGQAHSGWIFGAIAELVDNSRDAGATQLEIAINMVYSKIAGDYVPMLSVIDDGCGMTHEGILRMISFGHGQAETTNSDRIGRYGIGFKTGTMRLGKDALVLTQSSNSRSIAFLSQSLNEGKDNLEIPVVSYRRVGQHMEVDENIQTGDSAKYSLKVIKEISPFNKYLIGEKAGLFKENGTGTQIYIWNLDRWGSECSFQWESGMAGGSSFHKGGIYIRSKRTRSRPGQISQVVPLDYSLASYLEVIFLDPRMKIYVQGSLVKSRPLAKSLNGTAVENGIVLGKPVQLILGRSQLEWEQANCGIFLYWQGRLIEAYKRVGSMVHNGDRGRGVIGVIDVTDLMDDENGHVWVHNNKQGFQDCEAYAELETWLGEKADQYIDKHVDKIPLKKGNAQHKPDHDWVQCDKCRKWRKLGSDFSIRKLPAEWFCYMMPFNGSCDMPEEKVGSGVITVSTQRRGYINNGPTESKSRQTREAADTSEGAGDGDDSSDESPEVGVRFLRKRLRNGLPRSCKKEA